MVPSGAMGFFSSRDTNSFRSQETLLADCSAREITFERAPTIPLSTRLRLATLHVGGREGGRDTSSKGVTNLLPMHYLVERFSLVL